MRGFSKVLGVVFSATTFRSIADAFICNRAQIYSNGPMERSTFKQVTMNSAWNGLHQHQQRALNMLTAFHGFTVNSKSQIDFLPRAFYPSAINQQVLQQTIGSTLLVSMVAGLTTMKQLRKLRGRIEWPLAMHSGFNYNAEKQLSRSSQRSALFGRASRPLGFQKLEDRLNMMRNLYRGASTVALMAFHDESEASQNSEESEDQVEDMGGLSFDAPPEDSNNDEAGGNDENTEDTSLTPEILSEEDMELKANKAAILEKLRKAWEQKSPEDADEAIFAKAVISRGNKDDSVFSAEADEPFASDEEDDYDDDDDDDEAEDDDGEGVKYEDSEGWDDTPISFPNPDLDADNYRPGTKLRDAFGRYDKPKFVREIMPATDEELADIQPPKIFEEEPDAKEAEELGQIFTKLKAEPLISFDNYPFVQESCFEPALVERVQRATLATRAAALGVVIKSAVLGGISRRAGWQVRAASSLLFPKEEMIEQYEMQAAITQGVVTGFRECGMACAAIAASGKEEQVLVMGAWAEHLYNRSLPQSKYLDEDYQGSVLSAVAAYFDLSSPVQRERFRLKINEKLFETILNTMTNSEMGLRMSYEECMKTQIPVLNRDLNLILYESKPATAEAIFWLEVRGRMLLKDLLKRAMEQADPENAGTNPNELMSAFQLVDLALEVARSLLKVFWRLENPKPVQIYRAGWDDLAFSHLRGVFADLSSRSRFFNDYCLHFAQTALLGKRKLEDIAVYDLDVFRQLIAMTKYTANEIKTTAFPAGVAKTMYRFKEQELTDCLESLEEAFESGGAGFVGYRQKVLTTLMNRWAKRADDAGEIEKSTAWAAKFLQLSVAEDSSGVVQSLSEQLKMEKAARYFKDMIEVGLERPEEAARILKAFLADNFKDNKDKVAQTLLASFETELVVILKGASSSYLRRDLATGMKAVEQASNFVDLFAVPVLSSCGVDNFLQLLKEKVVWFLQCICANII